MTKTALFVCMALSTLPRCFAQSKSAVALKGESSITYRLVHPLHKVESTSNDFVSTLDLDESAKVITAVTARVDVETFNSGNSNRDSHAMEVIDAIQYPEVSFSSTAISQQGDSVHVSGTLLFHGQSGHIVIDGDAQWSPGRLEIRGRFDVRLTDFKIERPSLLLIPVEDKLSFTLDAVYVWRSGS
jgi:polyisoprenoid-binding protein YceI